MVRSLAARLEGWRRPGAAARCEGGARQPETKKTAMGSSNLRGFCPPFLLEKTEWKEPRCSPSLRW
uniref:Uncharacterized protein n=1 Tax=Arundo donax TaxID=35708 RepID=A0A0A8Z9P1_ARUDO